MARAKDAMPNNRELNLEIKNRQAALEKVRLNFDELFRDIADYVLPVREDWDRTLDRGERQATDIYDGTAPGALQLFTDGFHGYLVSPSMAWFKFFLGIIQLDEDPQVRRWLQESEEHLYGVFNNSNFYEAMRGYIEDGASIGTAHLDIEEDLDAGRLVFSLIHPAECWIAENKFGRVDVRHRKYKIMARQALQAFGEENLSQKMVQSAKDHPFSEHEFIHAIYPRDEYDMTKINAENKPFASVWVEKGESEKIARISGFDEFPAATWRYRTNANEIYGRSPASDALPEIIGLNTMAKTLLGAAEKAVDPAYNVPAEMKGKVRTYPRGLNFYSEPDRIVRPFDTGINYPVGIDREERKQRAIEQHFRVDFFLLLARAEKKMTATEILELQGEKAAA
jgi:hypothetical protein